MTIPTVEVVHVFPQKIWAEKDFLGTTTIYVQHDDGESPAFPFVQIHYDYRYTSNGTNATLAEYIMNVIKGQV